MTPPPLADIVRNMRYRRSILRCEFSKSLRPTKCLPLDLAQSLYSKQLTSLSLWASLASRGISTKIRHQDLIDAPVNLGKTALVVAKAIVLAPAVQHAIYPPEGSNEGEVSFKVPVSAVSIECFGALVEFCLHVCE